MRILLVIGVVLMFGCKENIQDKFKDTPAKINMEEALIQQQKAMIKNDSIIIANFLESKELEMVQTGTGLRYTIHEKAAGELIQSGERIFLEYVITDLAEDTLYSSEKSGVMDLDVDFSHAESGLHELVKNMRKGERALAVLPPHLAYGLAGDDYKIPAYTTLVFDVKILR